MITPKAAWSATLLLLLLLTVAPAGAVSQCEAAFAPSEHLLVERARKGDDWSFQVLMTTHREQLEKFLFKLIQKDRYADPDEEVRDLFQDVCLRTLVSVKTDSFYRGESEFSTWLLGIAKNAVADLRRKRATQLQTVGYESDEDLPPLHARDVSHIQSRLLSESLDFIDTLPSTLSETAKKVFIQELTHEQAAEQLGVQPNTVSGRIFRIRKRLAAQMCGGSLMMVEGTSNDWETGDADDWKIIRWKQPSAVAEKTTETQ